MLKFRLKTILFLLLYSLILLGLGYLAAILISRQFNYKVQDVLFYEGIIILMIGVLLSMKGNSSVVTIQRLGQNDAQNTLNENLDVIRMEKTSADYYKSFFKHSVMEFALSNLTMIIGGVLIMLLSLL